jgi:hypothetical protein
LAVRRVFFREFRQEMIGHNLRGQMSHGQCHCGRGSKARCVGSR